MSAGLTEAQRAELDHALEETPVFGRRPTASPAPERRIGGPIPTPEEQARNALAVTEWLAGNR